MIEKLGDDVLYMHTDFVWSDNWFLNALLVLSYWSTVYYPLSRLFVFILHLQHGVLIFSFKHQIRWWKVQWFPSTWFLTGVDVIGKLGLSSVIYSGLDTMSESRISFRLCWWSHLPACWYIFFYVIQTFVFVRRYFAQWLVNTNSLHIIFKTRWL